MIVSDTVGRAWRNGLCNVALGVAASVDYRRTVDDFGRPLAATVVAAGDEIAAVAELVTGKTRRAPAVCGAWSRSRAARTAGKGKQLVWIRSRRWVASTAR